MTDHERKVLGTLLVDIDKAINGLDREVFEAAYHPTVGNLDAQREHAMSLEFQPSVKQLRDQIMEQRNVVARLLGFKPRYPHDFSPRDYIVQPDGMLVP